jgi:cyanuric acid amidohydrolase
MPAPIKAARETLIHRVGLAAAADMSAFNAALARLPKAARIVAVLAKTPGDGGPKDTSRAEFVAAASALVAKLQAQAPAFVVSGGVEGTTAPNALIVARAPARPAPGKALAVGAAIGSEMDLALAGTKAQIEIARDAVAAAIRDGGFARSRDIHFVQIKGPAPAKFEGPAEAAIGRARAATVLGTMVALGDLTMAQARRAFDTRDLSVWTARVSVSSAAEFPSHEVIVFGHAPGWSGPLRIAHGALADPLDLPAVTKVLGTLGLAARPQLSKADHARLVACLAKSGPPPDGTLRGVDLALTADPSQSPLRRIRGGLGSLIAAATGQPQVFVSGGAEHQGPAGGGIFAAIARVPRRG